MLRASETLDFIASASARELLRCISFILTDVGRVKFILVYFEIGSSLDDLVYFDQFERRVWKRGQVRDINQGRVNWVYLNVPGSNIHRGSRVGKKVPRPGRGRTGQSQTRLDPLFGFSERDF